MLDISDPLDGLYFEEPDTPPDTSVADAINAASERSAALVEALGERLVQAVANITHAPAQVVQLKPATAVKSPTSWVFTFERNSDGTIKSITANARN